MFNFDFCLLVILLVLDRLALRVGEEGLVTPHLGLKESHYDEDKQGGQTDARPHSVVTVGGSVLYLLQNPSLVLNLVHHVHSILQQRTGHVCLAAAYWT